MATIKAIETNYAGCKFRSRLEARWAVFFDSLGLNWRYEAEGYELESGWYLPDFLLPKQNLLPTGCFIEIKGQSPTSRETALCHQLAEKAGLDCYIFIGDIPRIDNYDFPSNQYESAHKCCFDDGWDCYHAWCQCLNCGRFGVEYMGRSERINCGCHPEPDPARQCNYDSNAILIAYQAARSERFGR